MGAPPASPQARRRGACALQRERPLLAGIRAGESTRATFPEGRAFQWHVRASWAGEGSVRLPLRGQRRLGAAQRAGAFLLPV